MKRRRFSMEFKAKVALEAVKEVHESLAAQAGKAVNIGLTFRNRDVEAWREQDLNQEKIKYLPGRVEGKTKWQGRCF